MKKRLPIIFLILLLVTCVYALPMPLSVGAVEAPTKTCVLSFDNNIVLHDIWLAETPKQRMRGLAGRENINNGMLFVVPKPKKLSFWMKDTKMPLTIGFLDEQGVLFQIEDMQPETTISHSSKRKANKALELPAGGFQQYRLKLGFKLLAVRCENKQF